MCFFYHFCIKTCYKTKTLLEILQQVFFFLFKSICSTEDLNWWKRTKCYGWSWSTRSRSSSASPPSSKPPESSAPSTPPAKTEFTLSMGKPRTARESTPDACSLPRKTISWTTRRRMRATGNRRCEPRTGLGPLRTSSPLKVDF